MNKSRKKEMSERPSGYAALVERFGLDVIPNWHRSMIAAGSIHKVESTTGVVEEVYPAKYWPGDKVGDHLEFALKYDGTNLAILAGLFQVIAMEDVLDYVKSRPIGKYARRLWFLYELLTGKPLPMDDVTKGNYADLLESEEYYTTAGSRPVRRQRINDRTMRAATCGLRALRSIT